MPVTVVVGGQYGSEGKGKVCAHLASADAVDVMVRCGGPNAGHTVYFNGECFELKQVPAGFINSGTRLLLAAGSLVDPQLLLKEIKACGLTPERIGVDENAGIIEPSDRDAETSSDLRGRLGSTNMGVGSAVSRRVIRGAGFRCARDIEELQPFLTSTRSEVADAVTQDRTVVVEGTQGFGLSLYHTAQWPFCTSRDTTAHSFLSEVGLGVRDYDVVMAIRTYPIRVAGNSGPLPNELSWFDVRERSGYPHDITELTTTTKRVRRVAEFDWQVVLDAVSANAPTMIAIHGADYIDYANKGVDSFETLTPQAQKFVLQVQERTSVPVGLIGTGPLPSEMIDRRRATVRSKRRQLRLAN
jgi:adenylosuccinate synthase